MPRRDLWRQWRPRTANPATPLLSISAPLRDTQCNCRAARWPAFPLCSAPSQGVSPRIPAPPLRTHAPGWPRTIPCRAALRRGFRLWVWMPSGRPMRYRRPAAGPFSMLDPQPSSGRPNPPPHRRRYSRARLPAPVRWRLPAWNWPPCSRRPPRHRLNPRRHPRLRRWSWFRGPRPLPGWFEPSARTPPAPLPLRLSRTARSAPWSGGVCRLGAVGCLSSRPRR